MDEIIPINSNTMHSTPHFTTRRGFIASAGFGGISLYGLWAAYGAAPSPMALLGLNHSSHAEAASGLAPAAPNGGHAGHGAAAPGGPSAQEFSQMTADFSERFRMPDGSVYPRRLPAEAAHGADPHAGHNMAAMAPEPAPDPHAGHASHDGHAPAAPVTSAANPAPADHGPIDVLMTAGKWYYLPNVLRLDVGQAYRFRMMALDITHGASIQLGNGGRMMRLQPGRITETELTFARAGRYLMHCTVYCGEAHDVMQASIEVV